MRTGRHILLAEDDPTDLLIYQRAFAKLSITNYNIVRDGVEAVEHLEGKGDYANRARYPFPQWLVLDLKMPRMTGSMFWSGCTTIPSAASCPQSCFPTLT